MADALESVLYLALGMTTGGFLFTLGNFLSFRFFKRLNDPLIELLNEFVAIIADLSREEKQ